jgi:dGTPase
VDETSDQFVFGPPRKNLADWAVPDQGPDAERKHPEAEHPYRGAFQRDRDRVLHCSAFRRLDFKTQVFVPHEHDHFRTRLTHTLEVAQVARTLARALGLNEDLVETVALAHDLGHPPFGHAGEFALDALMADHGRFEHNRQSLRVVDYLEHPYPHFRGLNLTSAVRECIAKHETRYDLPISEDFDTSKPPPLEGQVVDLADEIAYTAADTEDALQAGWLARHDLAELELWRLAWDRAHAAWPEAREIHKEIRGCKLLVSVLCDDCLDRTRELLARHRPGSAADVRRLAGKCVQLSEPMLNRLDQLQRFLLEKVYTQGPNARRETEARRMLTDLFSRYLQRPDLLPVRYARRVESDGLHRTICDYIAGMTDRFCRQEHARLAGQ